MLFDYPVRTRRVKDRSRLRLTKAGAVDMNRLRQLVPGVHASTLARAAVRVLTRQLEAAQAADPTVPLDRVVEGLLAGVSVRVEAIQLPPGVGHSLVENRDQFYAVRGEPFVAPVEEA